MAESDSSFSLSEALRPSLYSSTAVYSYNLLALSTTEEEEDAGAFFMALTAVDAATVTAFRDSRVAPDTGSLP